MTAELKDQFNLPLYYDLGATFLYALTGALVAIRRQYDIVGLFVLALVTGLGGVEKSLGAGLSVVAAIMVGVINASGGGLLRDVLVREEPLLFKPGQMYVLAALVGACLFSWLVVRHDWLFREAALAAVGGTFVFRLLAIVFNWKTVSVAERLMPVSISLSRAATTITATPAPPAAPPGPPPVKPDASPNELP
jgi:uncharacterized membrane protein YeiH